MQLLNPQKVASATEELNFNFNLDLIETIALSQNGNQLELHSPFEVRNNILSFEIILSS